MLRGDFEEIKEITIPDHELELTKNFEEYPTHFSKQIFDYYKSNIDN